LCKEQGEGNPKQRGGRSRGPREGTKGPASGTERRLVWPEDMRTRGRLGDDGAGWAGVRSGTALQPVSGILGFIVAAVWGECSP
jgi:hypothetical protein